MITCPHCRIQLVGPEMPRRIEPGMECPFCGRDMNADPEPAITGLQVFIKYLGSILAGGTFGVLLSGLLNSVYSALFDGAELPGVFIIGLALIFMFAVGSGIDSLMRRRVTTRRSRWLLLALPFLATLVIWSVLIAGGMF